MEGGGTYGRKMKKYISICLKVLKIYIITGLIFFLACFGLDRVGLRMQKGFYDTSRDYSNRTFRIDLEDGA